jgi:hypothetical protein
MVRFWPSDGLGFLEVSLEFCWCREKEYLLNK